MAIALGVRDLYFKEKHFYVSDRNDYASAFLPNSNCMEGYFIIDEEGNIKLSKAGSGA